MNINSPSNPKIKRIAKMLKDSSFRKEEGVIVVDGLREIKEAVASGGIIKDFFYCQFFDKKDKELSLSIKKESLNFFTTSEKVFEKISYKKSPDGYLAVLESKSNNFSELSLSKEPSLVLVLESVEKPGNLGGIIRTAYASGVDVIILNDQKTDIYSPNTIRASTGFIFKIPIILESVKNSYDWLVKNNFQVLTTCIKADKKHFDVNFKKSTAIIFGSEAFGVSEDWLSLKTNKIKIPMVSGVDSLNVSVSVGVIVYEAVRQRKNL
jgi:RNA methyltransferase, TrmH family